MYYTAGSMKHKDSNTLMRIPRIIQAPMAGGITTPALVSVVSNAGGLGSFAAGYLSTDKVETSLKEIQQLTEKPFSINLFIAQQAQLAEQDLSAFYFDIRKDILYCDPKNSEKRNSTIIVLNVILNSLIKWFAPILSFTTEEIYQLISKQKKSVHLEKFITFPKEFKNSELNEKWIKLLKYMIT